MSDHYRVCQRAGCQQSAAVTLSFRYDARQASLVDLVGEKHPAQYDLCAAHADLLIVPRGWERLDRRSPQPTPQPEPQVEVYAGTRNEPRQEPHRLNRYAALTAELPRLAEAWGLTVPTDHTVASTQLYEPVTQSLMTAEPVLDGQLQMPIEADREGVVVALTRARHA
jgi:uncharacterized protein DUF3499